jgi:type VI protein secretion system component VasF
MPSPIVRAAFEAVYRGSMRGRTRFEPTWVAAGLVVLLIVAWLGVAASVQSQNPEAPFFDY